jgi:hypothetical protein
MPIIPLDVPFSVYLIRSSEADGTSCYFEEPLSWGTRPAFYRTEREAIEALKGAANALVPVEEVGNRMAVMQREGDRIKKACVLHIPIYEDHLKLVTTAREVVLRRVRQMGY